MSRVKGSNIHNWRRFVLERYGEERWNACTRRLSETDREELDALLMVSWHDVRLQHRVLHALVDELADELNNAASILNKLTEYEARQDFTVVHRLFFRMATPGYLLEQSTRYWHRFYDQGEWSVERDGNRVEATLSGFVLNPIFAPYMREYFVHAFTLVGARDAQVEVGIRDDVMWVRGSWS